MNGPVDEVNQPLAINNTVVICIEGQHYVAMVTEIHEPGLIAASGSVAPGGKAQGMELPGTVTLAIAPITMLFNRQNPRLKVIKVTLPKPPGGNA